VIKESTSKRKSKEIYRNKNIDLIEKLKRTKQRPLVLELSDMKYIKIVIKSLREKREIIDKQRV